METPEKVFRDIACPVCNSYDFSVIWQSTPNEFFNKKRMSYYNLQAIGIDYDTQFFIKKCKKCNFVFVNPRLDASLYSIVYNEAKSEQHNDKPWMYDTEDDQFKLYNTHHKYNLSIELLNALSYHQKKFYKTINQKPAIDLLDFGCGNGHILDLCNAFGLNAVGVDIDKNRLKYCRKKGLNVFEPCEISESKKFDIIIATSVIEHIDDLNGFFQYLTQRMHTGSTLHLTGLTPRIISIERKRGEYKNVMPLEHLNFFSKKSFNYFINRYNLNIIRPQQSIEVLDSPFSLFKKIIKLSFGGFYPSGFMKVDLIKRQ